jgi:hypothetical protein
MEITTSCEDRDRESSFKKVIEKKRHFYTQTPNQRALSANINILLCVQEAKILCFCNSFQLPKEEHAHYRYLLCVR